MLRHNRPNMEWSYTIDAGILTSGTPADDFHRAIMRVETNITRSEISIQFDLTENLSMSFAIKVRNQSKVLIGRGKTDTKASATLLLRL